MAQKPSGAIQANHDPRTSAGSKEDVNLRLASKLLWDALRSPESQELAKKFDGWQCQKWKAIADLKHWARSTLECDENLKVSQQMYSYREPNTTVVYVRNQKAASTYFVEELGKMLGGIESKLIYAPLKTVEAQSKYNRPSLGDNPFVFSAVRDPIETAVAAYLEVSKRVGPAFQDPLPTFIGMPCGTAWKDTSRFKMFLNEVRWGKPISKQFFHSYPQALKLDVSIDVSYSSILKLENFGAIWSVPGFDHIVPASSDDSHTTSDSPCGNLSFDPELWEMLCDMYRVDYECFGYSLPSACKN